MASKHRITLTEMTNPGVSPPTMSLVVEERETLGHIVNTGLRKVDFDDLDGGWTASAVAERITRVTLLGSGHEFGMPRAEFDVRDECGRLCWAQPFRHVTYGQLLDSVRIRLEKGDPKKLVFTQAPRGGGLDPVSLLALVGGLGVLNATLTSIRDAVDNYHWLKAIGARAIRLIRSAHSILSKNSSDLTARNANAQVLRSLLETRRSSGQFAELLGLDIREAEILLAMWGFVPDCAGYWKLGNSPEAALLRTIIRIAEADAVDYAVHSDEGSLDREKAEALGRVIRAAEAPEDLQRVESLAQEHWRMPS